MPGSSSRGDIVRSILLVVAALTGLVVVRWSVTGEMSRSIVAPAPTVSLPPPPPQISPAAGIRLSLGGRRPAVIDPASGSITPIPPVADKVVNLFRQGSFTVLVADGRAWAVPAGKAGPRRLLGRAELGQHAGQQCPVRTDQLRQNRRLETSAETAERLDQRAIR